MAIGINWKEVWADVWAPVWAQDVQPLNLELDAGSLTLTGQQITFTLGVALDAGSVTVAGQTVAFETDVALQAGSLTVAGQEVGFLLGGDIEMPLEAGSLTLTGGTLDFALTGQNVGAGRARKNRRRYYVEIDGERFIVSSAEEAAALLQQAARLAEQAAETAAQAIVKARIPRIRRLGKVAPVSIRARIKTDAPSTPELDRAKSAIQAIYDDAAQRAEMQLLLERQAIDDDERDIEDLIAIGAL